jgi:protoporphyrinogen oxidase
MKIAIIGGGLAGLTCACYLKKNGITDISVFESSERIGGKLKTDRVNGYQLDHGFQVLLPAYPETKRILDYDKLDLQSFDKGSVILKRGNKIPFYDPQNGFAALLETVAKGPGSLKDKVLLLKFKWNVSQMSTEEIFAQKRKVSALKFLKEFGFSSSIINDFWIPFYQGVFLENTLTTDSRMLQFTFKMFAESGAAVPKNGMQAIPEQLASFIGTENIKCNSSIKDYSKTSLTFSDGNKMNFDAVVVAYNENKETDYHSVTNWYFETETLPFKTKHVILNANGNRIVNNVVFISHVAPQYATTGKSLISVSANGINWKIADVLSDLTILFGKQVQNWQLLQTFVIREALPIVDFDKKYVSQAQNGVYYCGDYLQQSSINGAMESGRKAAETILKSNLKM